MDISTQLKRIRQEMGKTQKELASELGLPQQTWANYETGRSEPAMEIIFKLSEMGYTIHGFDGSAGEAIRETAKKTGLSEEEVKRQAIEHLHKLAETYPSDTPIDKLPKPDYKQELNQNDFVVPILDQSLSAGKGQPLPDDDNPIGYIAVPKELKRYGNKLAAIYVNGDSMEPTLQRGDLVVCDSCGWDGDGIYALRMDGCGYVKRLARKPGKLVVISDNPKYETWEEPTESEAVSIIGRVHYALKHVD